jgi:hypothetical protein
MAEAKAWRVVLSHVERQLRTGDLGPGDRLPGERDLASQLGVDRVFGRRCGLSRSWACCTRRPDPARVRAR